MLQTVTDDARQAAPVAAPAPDPDAPTLEAFLDGIGPRAFRFAEMALRQREDALDVVQDAFAGFLGGWGLWLSATLVLASLAWVTADSALFALGIGAGPWTTTAVAALLMAAFAAVSATGIRVSAAVQWVLAVLQLIGVGVLVWAVRTAPALPPGTGAGDGEWTGFYGAAELATGTGVSTGDVAAAVLLALFLYWGWDSTFSLTEESTTQRAPRVSAWVALGVVAAAYAAIGWAYAPGSSVASPLLAALVAVSAGASIGTTMIPTSRGLMSMARGGHLPRRLRGCEQPTRSSRCGEDARGPLDPQDRAQCEVRSRPPAALRHRAQAVRRHAADVLVRPGILPRRPRMVRQAADV